MKKILFLILLLLLLPTALYAAELPFVTTLRSIVSFFTNSFARSVATLAFIGAALTLLFAGQELSGFVKTLLYVVLVVTLIMNVTNIINFFFPAGEAAGGST